MLILTLLIVLIVVRLTAPLTAPWVRIFDIAIWVVLILYLVGFTGVYGANPYFRVR
jgi:hypothetical protein